MQLGHGDALTGADEDTLVHELRQIHANSVRSQHPLDPGLLGPLSERFVAAKEHIEQVLRKLPPSVDDGQVQKAASAFINLGSGDDGIFALRHAELQQIAAAQSALAGSRALAVQLGSEAAVLVAATQAATNASASRSARAVRRR